MALSNFYESLDAKRREIRLLELLPGDPTQTISCRLRTVSLDDNPQFEALSYVWGNPKNPTLIQVHDEEFPVTRNLANALRDLRLTDRVRILWIDAISINQQSIQERNQQVRLMGQIYRQAISVQVHMATLHPALVAFVHEMAENPDLHWEEKLKELGEITKCDRPIAQYVYKLFQYNWWNRVWTYQEAVLARELFIVCKDTPISFSTLLGFANAFCHHFQLEHCCKEDTGYNLMPLMWSRAQILKNLDAIATRFRNNAMFSFTDIISSERHRDATNPRDHVIGMLGLLQGYDSMIDYEISIVDVFTRSVLEDVNQTKTLDILSLTMSSDLAKPFGFEAKLKLPLEKLPSWVPNWAQRYSQYSLNAIAYRQKLLHLYSASKGMPATAQYLRGGLLQVEGIVCDHIVEIGRTISPVVHPERPAEINDDMFIVLPSSESSAGQHIYHWASNDCHNYVDVMMRVVCGDIKPSGIGEKRDGQPITQWTRVGATAISPEYAELNNAVTSNRRLFRTTRGYIGLGPKETQVNDIVCVLLGGKVPYILRQGKTKRGTSDKRLHADMAYDFIGDAYVQGLMDGQAVDQVSAGGACTS